MAQTIDTEFLEKERERLTTSLAEARTNLELVKNHRHQAYLERPLSLWRIIGEGLSKQT